MFRLGTGWSEPTPSPHMAEIPCGKYLVGCEEKNLNLIGRLHAYHCMPTIGDFQPPESQAKNLIKGVCFLQVRPKNRMPRALNPRSGAQAGLMPQKQHWQMRSCVDTVTLSMHHRLPNPVIRLIAAEC
jgi:hypothetical protein